MRALAVTGVGVASALGVGHAAFVEGIRSGELATRHAGRATSFDASKYPRVRVVEVADFDAARHLGEKGLRSLDRLTKLLVVATRLALHDAGLKNDGAWAAGSPDRVGMVVSNAYGSLEAITELDRVATLEDARYINPSRFPLTVSNSAAGYASIWEDLRALNVSVSDGNCGALDAVACANVFLERERADALLVGGAEAMSEALAFAFDRLGAVADGACLGEGAAILAIESPDSAHRRGATVLATIAGYGTAFVPPKREASLVYASSDAVHRAITAALKDADASAGEVDVVVSGVSGLRPFDEAEMLAIARAVGDETCVVAPKLALGETLGAGGAMAMLAAMALLSEAAPEHPPRHVVRGALRAQPRTALVTSMGYYGNASALVMRHPSR
ncbi:MAG TPA: beta-ketoacyl synthase N-terminal-like domain-containing protein [Polyangiaceae bacterium]|nr:beta-ketoacyl synthase N-terminal-like domain-containing protein [Polyangiaceae bacterium]